MADPVLVAHGVKRRKEIVRFVRSYQKRCGYSPTHGEIAAKFGVSRNAIRLHLAILEREGVLKVVWSSGDPVGVLMFRPAFSKLPTLWDHEVEAAEQGVGVRTQGVLLIRDESLPTGLVRFGMSIFLSRATYLLVSGDGKLVHELETRAFQRIGGDPSEYWAAHGDMQELVAEWLEAEDARGAALSSVR